MEYLHALILILVALSGGALALTRDTPKQVVALSFYGITLGVLFFIFQAPDVAFSQIVIGAVALPLMFMLALVHVKRNEEMDRRRKHKKDKEAA